jgi:hypothetical protein
MASDSLAMAMKMVILIEPLVFWRMSQGPEAVASSCASASCYRGPENIGIVAVVIFELTFRNVERHILGADFVERADNRPLEDRPKAFNRLRMHRADNVLVCAVHDGLVWVIAKIGIALVFIGRQQADFRRNCFADKFFQIRFRNELQDARHYVALALDCTNNRRLEGMVVSMPITTLAAVPVFAFAADVGFINLDDAHQLAKFLVLQSGANAMADVPSRLVRAKTHVALYLQCADALLSTKHQVNDFKPVAEIDLGVLKDRPDKVRETISAALTAIRAFPFKFHRGERINVRRAAARAMHALWPAMGDQIVVASFLIGEKLVKLACRQLVGFLSHFGLSNYAERIA